MGAGTTETLRKARRSALIERVLADDQSLDDESILEVLLCGTQRDPAELARRLLASFGCLSEVLAAPRIQLARMRGLGNEALAMVKAAEWIRRNCPPGLSGGPSREAERPRQMVLFDTEAEGDEPVSDKLGKLLAGPPRSLPVHRGTGMFAKSMLRDAIDLLPELPDTSSLRTIRGFLAKIMRSYSEETRSRYVSYLVHGLFPWGYADGAIRRFARLYAGEPPLAEVCFYRFCKAEPLMVRMAEDVLIPHVSEGWVSRKALHDYLTARFPGASDWTVKSCSQAAVDALVAAEISSSTRGRLELKWRAITLPSFAFVLHSEFQPGTYDLAKLERNPVFHALLWEPSALTQALYSLKEAGLLEEITESLAVRTFTTGLTLEQIVHRLSSGAFHADDR